jgi:hypothetical protein
LLGRELGRWKGVEIGQSNKLNWYERLFAVLRISARHETTVSAHGATHLNARHPWLGDDGGVILLVIVGNADRLILSSVSALYDECDVGSRC